MSKALEALITKLHATTAVTSLINATASTARKSIRVGFFEQKQPMPYVTLTLNREERISSASAWGGLMDTDVQIDIWAKTASTASSIKSAIADTLHKWSDPTGAVKVTMCEVVSSEQLDQPEEGFYRFSLDVMITTLGTT